jgi:DNA mismatch repair ATPase MutL
MQSFDKREEQKSFTTPSASQLFSFDQAFDPTTNSTTFFHAEIGDYRVLGQIWNRYIVLQSQDALYYVDQHALAERIAFETMKKEQNLSSELLLQPLKFQITQVANLEEKVEALNTLGFDIAML